MSNTSLSSARNKKARMVRRLNNASRQPEYPVRKRQRPHRSRRKMLDAIKGSLGLLTIVAERLRCHTDTVTAALDRPGWELVKESFKDERKIALGKLEKRLFNIAEFGLDLSAASAAAQFLLKNLHPAFHPKKILSIEGGDTPIKHIVLSVPADAVSLPINDRLALLKLADAKEAEFE